MRKKEITGFTIKTVQELMAEGWKWRGNNLHRGRLKADGATIARHGGNPQTSIIRLTRTMIEGDRGDAVPISATKGHTIVAAIIPVPNWNERIHIFSSGQIKVGCRDMLPGKSREVYQALHKIFGAKRT